jgi:hypothetical protein
VPACVSTASVDEERSRQITSEGGDRESEASAVAVQPARSFPFAHVTIATPEANSRIARRKFALLASGGTALIASASLQGHRQLAGASERSAGGALVPACSRQRKQMGSGRSVSPLMKGERPSAPTKGRLRLQTLAGWVSISLEKRSSLRGDGRSTHGASASFWRLSGAVP